jgi:hypothetical protein
MRSRKLDQDGFSQSLLLADSVEKAENQPTAKFREPNLGEPQVALEQRIKEICRTRVGYPSLLQPQLIAMFALFECREGEHESLLGLAG